MQYLPIRLGPGADLRQSLEALVAPRQTTGYFILSGIGSLVNPSLRLAGAERATALPGEYEITSLSGTVTTDGAHLHAVVSSSTGTVIGGHVVPGNVVRTTAEIVLVEVSGWHLSRALDSNTGFAELVVSKPGAASSGA